MAAPKKIKELVERFVRNREAYLSGGYNEAQVRQEFTQRQINATDKQIDKLVYKLYDLTDEEIAIVEKGVK